MSVAALAVCWELISWSVHKHAFWYHFHSLIVPLDFNLVAGLLKYISLETDAFHSPI